MLLLKDTFLSVSLSCCFGLVAAAPIESVSQENSRLVDFEVYRVNNDAEIRWISVGKTHQTYIVERSLDREMWTEAIRINGPQTVAGLVEFVDVDNDAPSAELYYRIKRFDSNGNAVYSQVVAVPSLNDLGNLKEKRTIKTFSRKVTTGSELSLFFDAQEHKDMLIVLRNPAGQEFFAKVNYTGQGDKYVVMDASNNTLPEGNYIITATSKDDVYSSNMIIGEGH